MTPFVFHYKSLLNVLETVQSKSIWHAAVDVSSYIALGYSNSIFIVVVVMLQCALWYIRPLSTLLHSESCDLVKIHQEVRGPLWFFRAYMGRFRCKVSWSVLYERFRRKWKWRFADKAMTYTIIMDLTTFFHSLILLYHIWIRDFPNLNVKALK